MPGRSKDNLTEVMIMNALRGFCHFRVWCPGSDVVHDCIDSRSLPPYLLLIKWSNEGMFS